MRKRICPVVLILISVILLIGVTGCMDTSKNTGKDTITIDSAKAEVLAALSQKYGKTFECVAYEGTSILKKNYTFCLVEQGMNYDGYGFLAYFDPYANDKITDGFFGISIRNQLADYIIHSNFSDTIKVFVSYNLNTFDNQLKQESDLFDALKVYKELDVNYRVFIPKGSVYSSEELGTCTFPSGLSGKIRFYEIPEDDYYELNYDNYNNYMSEIAKGNVSVISKGIVEF